jgi:radical SAM superfamily enzyme YgiQ (UPF0313 family)
MSFIRADKVMLNVVKKHSNLSNQLFSIGMEGFCQHIIDELGKGVQIDTAVELIDSITERKGKVSLTLMEEYPFLTENDVKESLSTIDRIKSIKEKGRLIYINSNGPVWWPGAKVASEYGFPIEKRYGEWYHCLLPKDSEQYKYNKQIIDYVRESGIPFVRGVRL